MSHDPSRRRRPSMPASTTTDEAPLRLGRRDFIAATAGLAGMAATGCGGGDSAGAGSGVGGTGGAGSAIGGNAGMNAVEAGGSSMGGGASLGGAGGMAFGGAAGEASGGAGGDGGAGPEPMPIAWDPEAISENTTAFPRTVMAGEMTPDGFMAAIYVADGQPRVLRIWLPGDVDGEVKLVVEALVTPDASGFVKAPITGLEPGTWYSYAFFTDVAGELVDRSLIGRVKTALGPDQEEPVTFTICSCNGGYYGSDGQGPFDWESMRILSEMDYDVLLHLGDQAYMDDVFEDGGTYQQYLEAWGGYHGGGYRRVYPKAGLYCTWDDHEVSDNSDTTDNSDWATNQGIREKVTNAINAFYTVLPIKAETAFEDPLYRSFRWGKTVEFIVLDCRYERSEPNSQYISPAQMTWLKQTLKDSPCRFKVILNSVPMMGNLFLANAASGDRWDGFSAQRSEILDHITNEDVPGVVWLTGDIHATYVADRVEAGATAADGRGPNTPELCVTSGNKNPALIPGTVALGDTSQYRMNGGDRMVTRFPHVMIVTLEPATRKMTVRLYAAEAYGDNSVGDELVGSPFEFTLA